MDDNGKVRGPVPHAVILDEARDWTPASPEQEEHLLVTFKVGRFGRPEHEERVALIKRMLRELKLKFPDVEVAGFQELSK